MTRNAVSAVSADFWNALRGARSILATMRTSLLLSLAAILACDTSDDGDGPGDVVASPVLCGELFSCFANNTPIRSHDGCETEDATMAICGAEWLVDVVDIAFNVEDVGAASIVLQHEDGGGDGRSLLSFTGDCAALLVTHVAREGTWDIDVECREEGSAVSRSFKYRAEVYIAGTIWPLSVVECVSGC